jgi:hypothetical protein
MPDEPRRRGRPRLPPAARNDAMVMQVLNDLDESVATILRLAELGPALDEPGAIYFPHVIELLALIAREAGHVERLSSQLARWVLPGPRPVEGSHE